MANLIRFDWAIKRLLREKANFVVLEGFLSELLGEKIIINDVLKRTNKNKWVYNRQNKIDLLATNAKEELLVVEIQTNYRNDFLLRKLYGTSVAVFDELSTPYDTIKKIYVINICYSPLGKGDDYIYQGTTTLLGMHDSKKLLFTKVQQKMMRKSAYTDPEYVVINIDKFDDITKNCLDEWIYYLKHDEVKDEFKAQGLDEMRSSLALTTMNVTENNEYWDYIWKWERCEMQIMTAYMEGFEIGRKEGMLAEK